VTASSSYYDRSNVRHIDGTHVFATAEDSRNELEVAAVLREVWGCELHRFGALSPVDWYSARDGRVSGLLELKSRTHRHDQYPTVFLNVRKWLALSMGAVGLGVPAGFVVRFTDGVAWIPIADVDASRQRIGGCSGRVKSRSDVEPVIEIPVASLRVLRVNA
jgi:hypothetical protein